MLLPLYQQYSFIRRLGRSQNWHDHSRKITARLQSPITMDNKFQKLFCICDEYVLIHLLASMKLEMGH